MQRGGALRRDLALVQRSAGTPAAVTSRGTSIPLAPLCHSTRAGSAFYERPRFRGNLPPEEQKCTTGYVADWIGPNIAAKLRIRSHKLPLRTPPGDNGIEAHNGTPSPPRAFVPFSHPNASSRAKGTVVPAVVQLYEDGPISTRCGMVTC